MSEQEKEGGDAGEQTGGDHVEGDKTVETGGGEGSDAGDGTSEDE